MLEFLEHSDLVFSITRGRAKRPARIEHQGYEEKKGSLVEEMFESHKDGPKISLQNKKSKPFESRRLKTAHARYASSIVRVCIPSDRPPRRAHTYDCRRVSTTAPRSHENSEK